jgi:glyoxylase-like metal-dependent hydrolase (beta-lactamase superfamily II)/rhodanese-related sulfurtransferase
MTIEQIYTGCLAQGAYYIESDGQAAIIDPLREVQPYIDIANKRGSTIKFVFETHFHADFVSGHIDLAQKTGATIVFGPTSAPIGYDALIGYDGQEFGLGEIKIRLIHTPGHTMESACFLLIDENGKEQVIFTGDTLFIGDVGRPDLAQHVISEMTQEKLAGHLFESLRNKIMPLSDDLIVYPAHGAGSACGKKMSKETSDTLGNQKRTNYALNPDLTREQFIASILDGLTPPPSYFPQNVVLNIKGYDSIDQVMSKGQQAFDPKTFNILANDTGAVVLDTRDAQTFAKGHIPNSINIGIDGSFATWVGTLVPDVKQELLIVAEPDRVEEVITRLSRVGFDNALGYLEGGIESWKAAGFDIDTIESVTAEQFANALQSNPHTQVVDVRRSSEFRSEHLLGDVINAPLDYINDTMSSVPRQGKVFVHCAGGYRSMAFVSILKARGFDNLVDVAGGFNAIKATGQVAVSDYVCPTTEL